MKQVVVIFDREESENDKRWLADELEATKTFRTVLIYPDVDIPPLWINKKRTQAYRAIINEIKKANKVVRGFAGESIVVCWSIMTGMLSKFLIDKKAIIISLNWLTPDKRFLNTFVRKMCIKDKRFYLFADQIGTMKEIIDFYKIKDEKKIGFFPDTFSDKGHIVQITDAILDERRKNRICFTGGLNNRNWNLLYSVALRMPDIHFIAVGCPPNFNKDRARNIESYHRLDISKYYELMGKAYLIYLPLCDERAAGAINMYRASKNHQVCLVTKAPSTEPYFPKDCSKNLIETQDLETNVNLIAGKFGLTNKEYIDEVVNVRCFLEKEYSPKRIANILISKIEEL